MLKKLLALFLALALLLSFAACTRIPESERNNDRDTDREERGEDEDDDEENEEKEQEEDVDKGKGEEPDGDDPDVVKPVENPRYPEPLWPNELDTDALTSTNEPLSAPNVDGFLRSISPDGKFALVLSGPIMDLANRLIGANPFGTSFESISLYSIDTFGNLHHEETIDLEQYDYTTPEGSTLHGVLHQSQVYDVSWSTNGRRVLVSAWALRSYFTQCPSGIYLIDFDAETITCVTDAIEPELHASYYFPQWSETEPDVFYCVAMSIREDDIPTPCLYRVNVETREHQVLVEHDGPGIALEILDFEIVGDTLYYLYRPTYNLEDWGLYQIELPDWGEAPAENERIMNLYTLRESDGVPTGQFRWIEVSPDGSTLLLISECYDRAANLHTADPEYYQHYVRMLDLETERFIDPFVNLPLEEFEHVTSACYAPDGRSVLCGTLQLSPDGATIADASLYQIRIDDGSFETVEIYNGLDSLKEYLFWIEGNYLLVPSIPGAAVWQPAAFANYPKPQE